MQSTEQPALDLDEESLLLFQCSSEQSFGLDRSSSQKKKENQKEDEIYLKKILQDDFSTSIFQFQIEQTLLKDHAISQVHKNKQNEIKKNSLQKNLNSRLQQSRTNDDTINLKQMLQILQKEESQQSYTNNDFSPEFNTQNYQKVRNNRKQNQIQNLPVKGFRPFHQGYDRRRIQQPFTRFHPQKDNLYHQFSYTSRFKNYPIDFYQPQGIHRQMNRKLQRREEFASRNYLFNDVLISIKLCSFLSICKKIILAPFSCSEFGEKVSKAIVQRIKYNMNEIYLKQLMKSRQKKIQDGYVFSVKGRGLQQNYLGVYFIKSPQNSKQTLRYYHLNSLRQGIKNVFRLLDLHNQDSIVIADLEWGTLSQNQISQLLIPAIFHQISANRKIYKCQSLREIIITVNNCENYELYLKYFRDFVNQLIS